MPSHIGIVIIKDISTHFSRFKNSIAGIKLPERFTYPFYYQPHLLSIIAAEEVQQYLEKYLVSHPGIFTEGGKMFGVLVAKNTDGEIGYLTAFSGKLDGAPDKFVPFVYSLPPEDNFYTKGMRTLHTFSEEIKHTRNLKELAEAKDQLAHVSNLAQIEIENYRKEIRLAKAERKLKRSHIQNDQDAGMLITALANESREEQYALKDLIKRWNAKIKLAEEDYEVYSNQLEKLKSDRASFSANLQKQLFEKYQFLNIKGDTRNLIDLFGSETLPPSGAGDCAAPKLLQYAFANELTPITMAEFWWGASPKTTIRHHKKYYPACNSKCKPILKFMLDGMDLDPNPMWIEHGQNKTLETVYEDDHILVINKPYGLLSVPGKEINESVATRMIEKYGHENPPMLVHRLDMDTSGLILLAKTPEVHKLLQRQFLKRTVKKRYTALLAGTCVTGEGIIDLPLRVDLDDRPNQMVCYAHGKRAITRFKVVGIESGKTRIHFFPETGRTHQLRVHAAHPLGLRCPIVGDLLYGEDSDRMYLHAEYLQFQHPVTRQSISFEAKADF